MSNTVDDILTFAVILVIAGLYYAARNAYFRAENERMFRVPERKYRPSSHKNLEVVIDERLDSFEHADCDIRITRAADWILNDSAKIDADEWLSLIEADREFELISELSPFPARWLGDRSGSKRSRQPDGTILSLENGNVVARKPTMQAIAKMCAVAEKLDAIVLDEEGGVIESNSKKVHPIGQVPCELASGATFYFSADGPVRRKT